jgi:tetratricopeptide (TPR) repeat protein
MRRRTWGGLDPDALGRRARALHLVGEVRDLRGDSEGALTAFGEAERTTAELLARDPENPDRMFDHAQSVFYVGQVAYMRKDWPTAETRFRRYVELADGMAATDPAKPKWIAEQAYAANSVGVLFLDRGNPVAAADQLGRYVELTRRLMELNPNDTGRIYDHAQANAWLADSFHELGRWPDARSARLAELRVYAELFLSDPKDARARQGYAVAQDALAAIALANGAVDEAVDHSEAGMGAILAMLAEDSANMEWLDNAVGLATTRAEALLLTGDIEGAAQSIEWALPNVQRLAAQDPANLSVRERLIRASYLGIAVAHHRGDRDGARRLDAAFRTRFPAASAGSTAELAMTSRMLVDTMAAFDALARGDGEAAQRFRASALGMSVSPTEPRRIAAIRVLNAPPFGPGDKVSLVTATGATAAGGYPLERLLEPVRGP